jgi:acyl-CoA reductase-like NAD-dependent aldehyde dehydrogenase
MLIAGGLVPAEGNRTFTTINPTTEEPLGTAADASVDDARKAIHSARNAFDTTTWATDPSFRSNAIRQLHTALVAHQEDLRRLIVAEVGAPLSITHGPQLDAPVAIVSWYADLLDKFEWSEDLGVTEQFGRMNRRWIEKEPVGVVAAIVPYNYPVQITLAKLVRRSPPAAPWS